MSGGVILDLQAITKRFGGLLANSDISINVRQGEILGLIGPNGAGKSTLFNIIAGTFPPTTGRVLFDNTDISRLAAPARSSLGIARTFQIPRSFESMTVLENVTVGAFVRHRNARAARRAAMSALEFADLSHRADATGDELTPPERRRLEVARALASEPRLLLLDEVLTGLTPAEAMSGVALIRRIRDRGVTVIMVEHVMEIVMPLVDRAVVLDLGRVLAEGSPSDVVKDPGVIKAYLGDRARVA